MMTCWLELHFNDANRKLSAMFNKLYARGCFMPVNTELTLCNATQYFKNDDLFIIKSCVITMSDNKLMI